MVYTIKATGIQGLLHDDFSFRRYVVLNRLRRQGDILPVRWYSFLWWMTVLLFLLYIWYIFAREWYICVVECYPYLEYVVALSSKIKLQQGSQSGMLKCWLSYNDKLKCIYVSMWRYYAHHIPSASHAYGYFACCIHILYKGKRQKAIYRLVTAPQGGTQKYTLAFAYDSSRWLVK